MLVVHFRLLDQGGTSKALPYRPWLSNPATRQTSWLCDSAVLNMTGSICYPSPVLFCFSTVGHRTNREASSILPEGFVISVWKLENL